MHAGRRSQDVRGPHVLLDGADLLHVRAEARPVALVALVETGGEVRARPGTLATNELPVDVDMGDVATVQLSQVHVDMQMLGLYLWCWGVTNPLAVSVGH